LLLLISEGLIEDKGFLTVLIPFWKFIYFEKLYFLELNLVQLVK